LHSGAPDEVAVTVLNVSPPEEVLRVGGGSTAHGTFRGLDPTASPKRNFY